MELRRLVSGLSSGERESAEFVMLQAWIDDSGTDQPPAFVFAGYIMTVRDWEDFADDWQDVLQQSPKLDYLKAEEAHNRSGQFAGWTIPERNARLEAFVSIMLKHKPNAIKSVIPHEDFKAVIQQNRGSFKSPELFTLGGIMLGVLDVLRKHPDRQDVEFLVDEDLVRPQQLEDAYTLIRDLFSEEDKRLLEKHPSFKNDKKMKPLQAADLYAWNVRRDEDMRARGETWQSPTWEALKQLPLLDCSYNRQEMQEAVDMMTVSWPRHLQRPNRRRGTENS